MSTDTPTTTELPRVRVATSPNPQFDNGSLLLWMIEDCPHCGRRHQHGAPEGKLHEDGTYGHRTEHCDDHTHVFTREGRRLKPSRKFPPCRRSHHGYILIPADAP